MWRRDSKVNKTQIRPVLWTGEASAQCVAGSLTMCGAKKRKVKKIEMCVELTGYILLALQHKVGLLNKEDMQFFWL